MSEIREKVCFKCGRLLPLEAFYSHPQTADGHLNKCKECTKKDVHAKYMENIEDQDFIERERKRGRAKWERLYKGKKHTPAHSERKTRSFLERRYGKFPEGVELHHWNYNYPHKVFVLSRRHHARLHKLIQFDADTQCFIYNSMVLLTKDEHEKVLQIARPGEPYEYIDCD